MAGVFIKNPPGWYSVTRAPGGLFYSYLRDKALIVQRLARLKVGVDTHNLRRSIHTTGTSAGALGPEFSIGSDVEYALVHHEGAKPHVITARNSERPLSFYWKKKGVHVITNSVNHPGHAPNRFLTESLSTVIRYHM